MLLSIDRENGKMQPKLKHSIDFVVLTVADVFLRSNCVGDPAAVRTICRTVSFLAEVPKWRRCCSEVARLQRCIHWVGALNPQSMSSVSDCISLYASGLEAIRSHVDDYMHHCQVLQIYWAAWEGEGSPFVKVIVGLFSRWSLRRAIFCGFVYVLGLRSQGPAMWDRCWNHMFLSCWGSKTRWFSFSLFLIETSGLGSRRSLKEA